MFNRAAIFYQILSCDEYLSVRGDHDSTITGSNVRCCACLLLWLVDIMESRVCSYSEMSGAADKRKVAMFLATSHSCLLGIWQEYVSDAVTP